jgi:hypothetical protein
MDCFIGTNRIFDTMEANGTARYFTPEQQPEGWVELKGRLSVVFLGIADDTPVR